VILFFKFVQHSPRILCCPPNARTRHQQHHYYIVCSFQCTPSEYPRSPMFQSPGSTFRSGAASLVPPFPSLTPLHCPSTYSCFLLLLLRFIIIIGLWFYYAPSFFRLGFYRSPSRADAIGTLCLRLLSAFFSTLSSSSYRYHSHYPLLLPL
jgi:hypothetical protein